MDIEDLYREGIGAWSGVRRVERSAALFSEMREMLARKIVAGDPGLSPTEVTKRVAECLYRSDGEALHLLRLRER